MARKLRVGVVGCGNISGAYFLLAAVTWFAGDMKASWLWLALFFLIFTIGELFVLPIGLGLFARLAPAKLGATTVAAWYLWRVPRERGNVLK